MPFLLPPRKRAVASWLGLACLSAGLCGCASTPLPPLHAPVPSHWRQDTGAATAPPTDLTGWWHAFGDARLDTLVDRALAGNLDVAQAVEHLHAARAIHRSDDERFLPQLHAKTEDAIDPDASASFFVAGFDALWELNLFGRGTAVQRQAQGDLSEAAADLRAARVSLVAEVVRSWLELRAAQQQVRWLGQIRDARRQQLDRFQVRQRLHLAGIVEVEQAGAALDQAEATLAEPREAVQANAQRLAVLLGQAEPDPDWLAPGPLPTLGGWRLSATPADLLRSRPEILHAQAAVLRAAGDAGVSHADRYPSLAIGGSLVWSTNLTTHRRTNDNALASVGPIVDIPLFDWGMRAAQARAGDHALRASVLAYRQAVLQGAAEVETALAQLARRDEDEHHCAAALASLAHVDQAMQKRVALRLASPADQTDSRIARDQAALALDEARTRRSLAFVALFKALGGAPLPAGDMPDLAQAHR